METEMEDIGISEEETKSSHFLELPEELIEQITTYLSFQDLKLLTQTCKYLNYVAWRSLGALSILNFWKVLLRENEEAFLSTKRIYRNIKVMAFDSEKLRMFLQRMESIPSISLQNIILTEQSLDEGIFPILRTYCNKIKSITLPLEIEDMSYKDRVEQIKSIFPFSKIHFQLTLSLPSEIIDFDELNVLLEPKKLIFETKYVFDYRSLQFKKKVSNIRHLIVYTYYQKEIEHFTDLTDLEIYGNVDLKILETIIERNKSLNRLRLTLHEPWTFKLPFQLKELACSWFDDQYSTTYAAILEDQRFLRRIFLESQIITDQLLDVLDKNIYLSTISFSFCRIYTVNLQKFAFLRNVAEVYIRIGLPEDITLLNTVLNHSERMNRLSIYVDNVDKNFDEIQDLDVIHRYELRILSIDTPEISKYVSRKIKCSNLEDCRLGCYFDSFFDCIKLRELEITSNLSYSQVVDVLKAFQKLERFEVFIDLKSLHKMLEYISNNRNNLKNILFFVEADSSDLVNSTTKRALEELNIPWTHCGLYEYQTKHFSFSVIPLPY